MDIDKSEVVRLYNEYQEKQKVLAVYTETSRSMADELSELEAHLINVKAAKNSDDAYLAELKNEEALLAIELSEIVGGDETIVMQKLDESLLDFSTTGTEEDAEHNAIKITELTKKVEDLEAEVKTLSNDVVINRLKVEERAAEISELSGRYAGFMNDIATLESVIPQIQAQKQALTSEQDEARQALIEEEMKQRPKAGAERGNAGVVQFDSYIKKIRAKLTEARDQKRQTELQHMDISQRLDKKRRNREMAEKSRVTDATIALMREVRDQLSFIEHLKICIEAFYVEHSKLVEQVAEEYRNGLMPLNELKKRALDNISKFHRLLEMSRNSIFVVLSKVPAALHAEIEQLSWIA